MTILKRINIKERGKNRFAHLYEKASLADIAAIGHHTEFGYVDPGIHLMNPRVGKIFGPAVTVKIPANESKALHLAVSVAQEGDVIVVDRCLDRIHACVGEMVALGAKLRKVAGIIVDGPITDFEAIREIGIPVFARGITALTTKFICDEGEINGDISCGGVVVHPGDLVIGDENGILVFHEPDEAEMYFDEAIAEQGSEAEDRGYLMEGQTLQQLYVPEYPLS